MGNSMSENDRLGMWLGPMFSGKTKAWIENLNNFLGFGRYRTVALRVSLKVKDKTEESVKKVGAEGAKLGKKGLKETKKVAKKGAKATKKVAKKGVKETKKAAKKVKKKVT